MEHKGLLIYPPSQLLEVEIPKPDGSLGLLYLAAALEKNGIKTDILDANIGTRNHSIKQLLHRFVLQNNGLIKIGMSFEEIANYIDDNKYTFVGITSNFTSQTRMVIETAKAIKNINPNIKIYTGGTNAQAIYDRFLNTKYFDGVCLTEGELIFPRMLKEGIENIPGWAYLNNGNIKINPIDDSCFPSHLDDLPMPAWNKLIIEKYDIRDVTDPKSELSSAILTSRGCIFKCSYCHISGKKQTIGKLRLHSLDRVIAEIRELKKMGIERIYFEDDSLLAIKSRVKELFKLVKEENIKFLGINGINLINFFDKTKEINGEWQIDMEYLKMIRDAGLYQMAFPIESGSQRIIDKYASGKVRLNKMNIIQLMKVMNEIGIKAPVNLIIGFPDETEEEIQKSVELGKKLKEAGAIYVSFFFPVPFPGTKLYDIAIKGKHLDKDFDTDIFNWKRPVMKNTLVPPEKLIEIREKANIEANNKEFIEYIEGKTIKNLRNK